jgi:DNA-binding response OmpR family regulator
MTMVRPCFLVIDREFASSISTRKLVIETAKFNVITAYSSQEAIATLNAFPAIDGAVLDANMPQMPCSDLVVALKQIKPSLPVIVVSAPGAPHCNGADFVLESFNPAKLLNILQGLKPKETTAIEARNEELNRYVVELVPQTN